MTRLGPTVAALLLLAARPSSAFADWLVSPFIGTTFGGTTNVVVFDPQAGNRKLVVGGGFAFLSDSVFGVEVTGSHVPHFFEGTTDSLVLTSSIATLTGNVLAAIPQRITGYSLRPYLVGGIGVIHASSRDAGSVLPLDTNVLALTFGGGAIGMLSNAAGLRFEVRHYRNLQADDSTLASLASPRIRFWQASVGGVYRF